MPVTIIEDKVYTTPDGSRFNTEVEAIQHQKDIASKELDKIFMGIFYFRNLNSLLVERAPSIIKALSHADVRCETINSIMEGEQPTMLSINEQDKINAVRRKLFYAKKLQSWCEKRINEYTSQLRVVGRC